MCCLLAIYPIFISPYFLYFFFLFGGFGFFMISKCYTLNEAWGKHQIPSQHNSSNGGNKLLPMYGRSSPLPLEAILSRALLTSAPNFLFNEQHIVLELPLSEHRDPNTKWIITVFADPQEKRATICDLRTNDS